MARKETKKAYILYTVDVWKKNIRIFINNFKCIYLFIVVVITTIIIDASNFAYKIVVVVLYFVEVVVET